eukprot:TRINITY_DN5172_c0_g2_i1.p1 TRINITY_DN5172_c0_g2~~TRINITY_DN5172_c0_g2_i1.p1  ORF type:complete len:822 (-),score=189.32 TRINITY_DN5172_c0_g2_i1:288-2717(-)
MEYGNVIKRFLSFNRFQDADEASNEAEQTEQPEETKQEEGTLPAETDGSIMEEEESVAAQQEDAPGEDAVNWGDEDVELEGDAGTNEVEDQEDDQFRTQAEDDTDDLSSLSVGELHQRCLKANVKLPDGIVGKAKLVQLLAAKLGLQQGGPVQPAEPPPAALVAKRKRSVDLREGPFPKSGLLGGPRPPSFPPPPPPQQQQPGVVKAPKDVPPKAGFPAVVPLAIRPMPGKAIKMVATAKNAPKPPTEPPPQTHAPHPPGELPNQEARQRPEALSPTTPGLQFHQPGPLPPATPPPLSAMSAQQQAQAKQQLQEQLKQKRAQELLQHMHQKKAKEQQQQELQQQLLLRQQQQLQQQQAERLQKQQDAQQVQSTPPPTASSAASTSHSANGDSLTAFEEAGLRITQSEEDRNAITNLGDRLGLDEVVQLGLTLLSREKLRPILEWLPRINAIGDKNQTVRLCIHNADPSVTELLKRIEEEENKQISQSADSPAQAPNGHAAPKTPPKAPPKAIPKAPRKDDTQANAKAAARTACLAAQASAASTTQPIQPPKANQPGVGAGMPAKINMSLPSIEAAKAPQPPQTVPPAAKAHVPASPKAQTVPPAAKMHISRPPMVVQSTRPQQPVQPLQPAPPAQHAVRPGLQHNSRPPMPCNPWPASAQELRSNPVGVGVTNPRPPGKGNRPALPGKGVAQRARSRSRSPPVPKQPQPPAMPPPRATQEQVKQAAAKPRDELDAWLASLDDRGVMLQYSAAVHREFDSVSQLSAAVVDPKAKGLKVVEPAIWETLGITTLGHKLHFAKGLEKLVASES